MYTSIIFRIHADVHIFNISEWVQLCKSKYLEAVDRDRNKAVLKELSYALHGSIRQLCFDLSGWLT